MSADRAAKEAAIWAETAILLWPGATVAQAVRGDRPTGRVLREFVYIPNARHARLLLPAGAPRAAAAALRRYSHDLQRSERIVRHVASAALGTGLPQRALPDLLRVTAPPSADLDDESVETYLSGILNRQIVVSLGLGTPRANRKPVLHVLTPEGETVAFVKVGDTDMARELVHSEAANLIHVGTRSLTHLAVPRVLHHGTWRGVELLVLSPLATTARRWQRRDLLPVDAMSELFAVDGADRRTVGDSAFWRSSSEVPGRLTDPESSRLLSAVVARTGSRYGDTVLDLGAWHGDWTPWNMAWHRSTVQLWDWERFGQGVPRGFDALHYRLQMTLRSASGRPPSLPSWADAMREVLARLGVSGRQARATTVLYLLQLCCRYLLAAQGSTGAPLRPRARWLLGALHEHTERL